MAGKPLVCLGRYEQHSCESWSWYDGRYRRECMLVGCSFSETASSVRPMGGTEVIGGAQDHAHDWTPWQTTADQFGLYMPPWGYTRTCSGCGAVQRAENVEAVVA